MTATDSDSNPNSEAKVIEVETGSNEEDEDDSVETGEEEAAPPTFSSLNLQAQAYGPVNLMLTDSQNQFCNKYG